MQFKFKNKVYHDVASLLKDLKKAKIIKPHKITHYIYEIRKELVNGVVIRYAIELDDALDELVAMGILEVN